MASRPPTLDELRSALLAKGGTNGDWAEACNGRFSTHEVDWVDGRSFKEDVWAHAQGVMSRGDHVEYVAYDVRGRDQGFAVIRLLDWIDLSQGFLKAHHEIASDEYYEYYAGQSLKDGDAAYHLCRGARGRCPSRLPRGDRREVVHLQRWRLMSPMMLVNSGYAAGIGLKLIQDYVDGFSPRVPEPGAPPVGAGAVPVGTGLDAAAAEAAKTAAKVAEAEKSQKGGDRPSSAATGSVGALLEQRAAERRKELLQKKEKERRKRRSRSRSRKKKRHRSQGSRGSRESRRIKDALLVEEGADTEIEAEINIDKTQKVVVFDFFAGVGGLSRALEMAKVPVVRHVAVEKDKGCRRLYATRWPGAELWSDIEKVRRKDIEKVLRSSPGVTGVVGAGGSPCQGLSKLSVNRKHLQDERSALFYTLKTTLKWVEEIAQELGIWCLTSTVGA
eukprot:Skav223101  [mRNA]  locus=scaffold419:604151:608290:+ [translate_table: standard]